jgi:hypothetical protein
MSSGKVVPSAGVLQAALEVVVVHHESVSLPQQSASAGASRDEQEY